MRRAKYARKTEETDVMVRVNIDGSGKAKAETGIRFLNHMIEAISTHSLIDIEAKAKGDLKHHVVEDVAIGIGEAMKEALGDRVGIYRFGYSTVPMDCSLALAAIDLVKRPYCMLDLKVKGDMVEDMEVEAIHHFFTSLSSSLKATFHIQVHYGSDDHHKVEAAFKALALSLRQASSKDPRRRGIPSAKGVI